MVSTFAKEWRNTGILRDRNQTEGRQEMTCRNWTRPWWAFPWLETEDWFPKCLSLGPKRPLYCKSWQLKYPVNSLRYNQQRQRRDNRWVLIGIAPSWFNSNCRLLAVLLLSCDGRSPKQTAENVSLSLLYWNPLRTYRWPTTLLSVVFWWWWM